MSKSRPFYSVISITFLRASFSRCQWRLTAPNVNNATAPSSGQLLNYVHLNGRRVSIDSRIFLNVFSTPRSFY